MAAWKRLTQHFGSPVDVNMDQVAYMRRINVVVDYDKTRADLTEIIFVVDREPLPSTVTGRASGILHVKETPDEIHKLKMIS